MGEAEEVDNPIFNCKSVVGARKGNVVWDELEKQVMDHVSTDFPYPTSIQHKSYNRILISFGERPNSLPLEVSKGHRSGQQ